MFGLDPLSAALVFTLGFIAGFGSSLILRRNNLKIEKRVSLMVIFLWLGMSTVAFASDLEVSKLFDFIGFGAAGHFIGLDIATIVNVFKKR